MDIVIIILLLFLEVYTGFLVLFVLFKLLKKRRVLFVYMLFNAVLIAAFFFLRKAVFDNEIVFIVGYRESTQTWGEGLANIGFIIKNGLIVLLIFIITQIVFWALYGIKLKKLNDPEANSKDYLDQLLDTETGNKK